MVDIRNIDFGFKNNSKGDWLDNAKNGRYESITIESLDHSLINEIINSLPKYVKPMKSRCSALINGEFVYWPIIKFNFSDSKKLVGDKNETAYKRFLKIVELIEKFELNVSSRGDGTSVYSYLKS